MSLHKYLDTQTQKVLLYRHLLAKISKVQQSLKTEQSGFTLIELLVSIAILAIVIALVGTGLVFTISKNTSSDIEIAQQTNLRRALDFIGDEVKSSSLITATDPVWITGGLSLTTTSPTATPRLYLRIPVPVEPPQTVTPADAANTIRIQTHGLTVGNAVRFSFNGTSTSFTAGTNYYVRTVPTNDLITVGTTATAGSDVTFTSRPQNFALQRLVAYYTVEVPSNTTTDKGRQALYRATGKCTDATNNCLLMIDSLAQTSPFTVAITGQQAVINLNGWVCNPASLENIKTTLNTCTTNAVGLTAVSRATLQ